MRIAHVHRVTQETDVSLELNLDGTGAYDIRTSIGFLDHMLEQLSRHSLMDISLRAQGDTNVDSHHTTEDIGLSIGEALARALGKREGIHRYGLAYVPLDEALTRVAIDLSNRPFLVWHVTLGPHNLGAMDTELFKEWFQAFARAAGATVHVACLYGENHHHIVEGCYKALAVALRQAIAIDSRRGDAIPSTKGRL